MSIKTINYLKQDCDMVWHGLKYPCFGNIFCNFNMPREVLLALIYLNSFAFLWDSRDFKYNFSCSREAKFYAKPQDLMGQG
jgi:hypothetical protein